MNNVEKFSILVLLSFVSKISMIYRIILSLNILNIGEQLMPGMRCEAGTN